MKKLCLLLITCLIATAAVAQYPIYKSDSELIREKRFQPLNVDGQIFLLDSTKGDLWTFNVAEKWWEFIGSPRRANTRRKGTYQLLELGTGGLLILENNTGEAWWTDGKTWTIVDDPKDRERRKD